MSHAYGSLPRKEDARFIKGQGTFIDDVALPGMLHGAILRSPLAHARIVSVDATAARAHPMVVAVLTGADLAERGLAWMPTLFGDVQSVLATDKVRFQGQEIAFVVATDRYAARDALELIAVDYEPLPPLMDALTALEPGAPVVREDHMPGGNRVFDWSAGDKAATDAAFAAADVVVECDMLYPRSHPAPLETCGAIAEYDATSGRLTLWSTSQAPHAHRTMYATVTGLPEHKIRIVSPDLGGGFGAKVPLYPGYVCAIAAAMETGRPVKWMEDRSESLMSTAFARDYHMHGEIAATADGEILGLRGAGAGRSRGVQRGRAAVQVPGRLLPHLHRLLPGKGGVLRGHRRVHEQGAGRGRLLVLVPRHRGRVPGRAADGHARPQARDGPGRAADAQSAAARAVPVHEPDRLAVRLGRVPEGARSWRWTWRATTSSAASRRSGAPAASTWGSG